MPEIEDRLRAEDLTLRIYDLTQKGNDHVWKRK